MSGGLAEQSNVIDLGDIILEVNNIPIHSAEDLSALVSNPYFDDPASSINNVIARFSVIMSTNLNINSYNRFEILRFLKIFEFHTCFISCLTIFK